MVAKVRTVAFHGVEVIEVETQVTITSGLPAFNVVVLPLPADLEEEVKIVNKRVGEIGSGLELPKIAPADHEIMRIVTVFRELRDGQTLDFSNGKPQVKNSAEDKAAIDAAMKDIESAEKEVTFEAPKKNPAPKKD